MYKYQVNIYKMITGGSKTLSYLMPITTKYYSFNGKLTEDEIIKKVMLELSLKKGDCVFEVVKALSDYEKLEQEFVTLEINFDAIWEENKKLKEQLSNRNAYINRLVIESHQWFEKYSALKESK